MEPTSSALSAGAAMGAVAVTSMLPGINGEALIGAFAGAMVFALHAKDLGLAKRAVYMLISILVGYLAAPEIMRQSGIQNFAVSAFVGSAFVVTFALVGIDKIKAFDITSLWKRG